VPSILQSIDATTRLRPSYDENSGIIDHTEIHEAAQVAAPKEISMFQLCFRSLFNYGRGFAFPCDSTGHVDMDRLSERARNNYFFARAMVGRDLAVPAVEQLA